MRILIVVTHLLGIGHLARATLLGRGLADAGHDVCLAAGGRPVPHLDMQGLDVVQLLPVHCRNADFRTLWTDDGAVLDETGMAARREALLDTFDRMRPDVVVTETYPFGRRSLRGEFEALVEAVWARPDRPVLLASVRDILNPPARPEKVDQAETIVAERYDGVLVHGDPAAVPLEASWPVGDRLRARLIYTGYVAEGAPVERTQPRTRDVVVSGGGGVAGLPLFEAAVAASRLDARDAIWRVLVGHGVPDAAFEALAAGAHPRLVVERARRDFREFLARSAVSISQSGYNTALDIAAARTPAVLVPFEDGGEREQSLRATRLAASGLAVLLPASELSPTTLLKAVEEARTLSLDTAPHIVTRGVEGSVAAIEDAGMRARRNAAAWGALDERLDALAREGRPARLWWRDDDAAEPCDALDRLLEVRVRLNLPLALAVSPRLASDRLATRLSREPDHLAVIVHGIRHANNAPPGRKSCELGYRPAGEILEGLREGLGSLRALFGPRVRPLLAPPWNRIDDELVPHLRASGYRGLSTFGPRKAAGRNGLAVVNTHCDPIAWRHGRGLADEADILEKLVRDLDRDEPIGILTHHLAHDRRIWHFVERLLQRLAVHPGAVWMDTDALMATTPDNEEAAV
ncbi:glycosyltransferase [Aureimonas phyllosphaerae]|uniref:Putative glycosyltransferase n=1 Tax=Aureimonas phyllosphaerae TaxID=1166078 RepID=A0A7W6BPX6_9HYPH|nr:glycosyltransferase [Aureimonas phyllosphaerae]MBB3934115.1 putative glycosyltransferase [Aureimonas phyllosphaerae]MBB3958669.1 putative glycosyltransferase [Aureimonas phyllosphaerae]SFF17703.1 Predicted glycosyl transferase [Aureimonas phyllosphaerae]